jgi:hypothetical protein
LKKRLALALLACLVIGGNRPIEAQSNCGYRVLVTAVHYIPTTVGPPYATEFPAQFEDAGPPLMSFLNAAARASTLAKDGAWWSIVGPPARHYLYPPALLKQLELIYKCE